jgi:hypothetical protein
MLCNICNHPHFPLSRYVSTLSGTTSYKHRSTAFTCINQCLCQESTNSNKVMSREEIHLWISIQNFNLTGLNFRPIEQHFFLLIPLCCGNNTPTRNDPADETDKLSFFLPTHNGCKTNLNPHMLPSLSHWSEGPPQQHINYAVSPLIPPLKVKSIKSWSTIQYPTSTQGENS